MVGFYDPDIENANKVKAEFGIRYFENIDDIIKETDIIDIVTPTISHFDCATKALKGFKHVFIEKPVVTTPEEAKQLIALSNEAEVKVQVGHVERFNPAFTAAKPLY